MGNETKSRPLAATEFTPLGSGGARKEWKFSPLYLGLGLLVAIAVVVFAYLFAARAVIFRLDPETASLSISGLSFHIGNNFLLLPGATRFFLFFGGSGTLPRSNSAKATCPESTK